MSLQSCNDWRLPKTLDGLFIWGDDGTTTGGYNITTSEMGYTYDINLGNKGYYSTTGFAPQPDWKSIPNATFVDGNGKTMSFQHLESDVYCSGTAYAYNNCLAWGLDFRISNQALFDKGYYEIFTYSELGQIIAAYCPECWAEFVKRTSS